MIYKFVHYFLSKTVDLTAKFIEENLTSYF